MLESCRRGVPRHSGAQCRLLARLTRRRRALRRGAWVGAVVAAVFVGTSIASGADSPGGRCGDSAPPPPGEAYSAGTYPRLILDPDERDVFLMDFGDSRRTKSDSVLLEAHVEDHEGAAPRRLRPDDELPRVIVGTDYLWGPDGSKLMLDGGLALGRRITDAGNLEVCLAVAPADVADLRPGRYAGSIRVGASESVSISADVTFRSSRWSGATMAFFGVLLGIAVRVFSEAAAAQRAKGVGARHALRAHVLELTFPVTLILGVIAGWLGFLQMYTLDPVWGAGGTDAAKLFGVCFVAQMSSSGGIDLVKRVAGGPAVPAPVTSEST